MNNQRRRFRPRQQRNGFRRKNNNGISGGNIYLQQSGTRSNFSRNGSANNAFSVEKRIQKYQQMAKDALSSGDPVLSENYFQHAEHFSRRLSELNVKSKESTSVNKESAMVNKDDEEVKPGNS